MKYLIFLLLFLCACSKEGPMSPVNIEIDESRKFDITIPSYAAKSKNKYCGIYYKPKYSKYYSGRFYRITGTEVSIVNNKIMVTRAEGFQYFENDDRTLARTQYTYTVEQSNSSNGCKLEIAPIKGFTQDYFYSDENLVSAPALPQQEADSYVQNPVIDFSFTFRTTYSKEAIIAKLNRKYEQYNIADHYYIHQYADTPDTIHYSVKKRSDEKGIAAFKFRNQKNSIHITVNVYEYALDLSKDVSKQLSDYQKDVIKAVE